MTIYHTAADIAEILVVDQRRIKAWIKSGELSAVDVGPRAKNRRWRISQEALDAFLVARSAQPPALVARRRQRADPLVTQYF